MFRFSLQSSSCSSEKSIDIERRTLAVLKEGCRPGSGCTSTLPLEGLQRSGIARPLCADAEYCGVADIAGTDGDIGAADIGVAKGSSKSSSFAGSFAVIILSSLTRCRESGGVRVRRSSANTDAGDARHEPDAGLVVLSNDT
eukprot:CAMPEP_0119319386 /NCGR_PEP_ID=MMETSP1333-20130426/49220_1 /TAXON_ID=418940 /ORGANISM="Scyphosphaera apsteinii, Strain RCC1455" /LENGTH=141 /DNA_ID=CAMNT_0007325777 /DNA_START=317 /DNA_END=742 /DNA_ORIENTATION=+